MVSKSRRVIIDNEAKSQLHLAYNYIREASFQNAEKLRNKILTSIKGLIKIPKNIHLINTGLTMMEAIGPTNFISTGSHTTFLMNKSLSSEYGIRK